MSAEDDKETQKGQEETPSDEKTLEEQLSEAKELLSKSSDEGRTLYELNKKAVESNPKHLLDVFETRPELAEKISQKVYGKSFEDAKTTIDGFNGGDVKESIKKELKDESLAEKAQSMYDTFISEKEVDEEKFKEIFDDLQEGKKKNPDNFKKSIERAYREYSDFDSKSEKIDEKKGKLSKSSISDGNKKTSETGFVSKLGNSNGGFGGLMGIEK